MEDTESNAELILYRRGDKQLADVFMELGRDYMSEEPEEQRDRFLRSVLDLQGGPDRWLYFLKVNDEVVGFIHFKVDTTDRPGWGLIMELYIRPECRMRGWGRFLLNHTAEEFKQKGVNDLWLTANTEAMGFWRAVGFVETGEIADYKGYPIMVKHLRG